MKRTVVFITLIAMLLAACGDDDSDDATTEPVSITDALETSGDIIVTGYLFVLSDGTVVLAESLAESFPPQPGGATIPVAGLDLATVDLQEAPDETEIATAKWSEEPITLTGSIADGVLGQAELG